MGAHIGHHKCHATFRQHSIEFRGLTALFGHMGLELDPLTVDEQEREGIAITPRCTSSGAR
jgi:alpha-galactosidase